jgi:transposase
MQLQLKTILNAVERHSSFVYQSIALINRPEAQNPRRRRGIEVTIVSRANGRPICSGCQQPRPGYDRLPPRRFRYLPLWGMAVYFVYALRRVNCPQCGVKAERIPWAKGKSRATHRFQWFLAAWAKRLSWKEVAEAFDTSWNSVFRAVRHAMRWGLIRRTLDGIQAIGVDEVQWGTGHVYLTLVYQIDGVRKRLLYVAERRTKDSLRGFFRMLTEAERSTIRFVCSDMCQAYLTVLKEQLGHAVHVLDRFHIVKKLNEALDEVRRAEVRQLQADGYEPVLKHSRWCLLKRAENLTERQAAQLKEILKYNLKSAKAHLMTADFYRFWEYTLPACAGRFLKEWTTRALRSRIEPMQKVARTLRKHEELILNWFVAKKTISSGAVEGLNNKLKLVTRKAYGFRTFHAAETALYHTLGDLPVPKTTHEFW